MKTQQDVILLNEQNLPAGIAEKLYAHQRGLRHLAFSIFVVRQHNNQLELLLQQRADSKYHSPGLWTNTCCSHPVPNEPIKVSATLRLFEETGIDCNLQEIGCYSYRAELDQDMIEDEFVHVFVGTVTHDTTSLTPNPDEVSQLRWLTLETIISDLTENPNLYTAWFSQALDVIRRHHKQVTAIAQQPPPCLRFSQYERADRLLYLWRKQLLTTDDLRHVSQQNTHTVSLIEHFIENTIGYFELPLGIAIDIPVDDKTHIVPLAVEETSIIAALSKMAKWVGSTGSLSTETLGNTIIGQIQISRLRQPQQFCELINQYQSEMIEFLNQGTLVNLAARQGGAKEITIRLLPRPDEGYMGVIHLHMDPVDAMGANLVNLACEALKAKICALTHEVVSMCIVSNLVDRKLTRATITLPSIEPKLGEAISEASLFANLDPYRAATNNKGILNAIDGLLIATGNDWRAIEAGAHAYAAQDGQYRSLTHWHMQDQQLIGTLTLPLNVGTVGGVTRTHPTAKLALQLLQVNHAHELARIAVAIGLLQNLAAIRALVTEGISLGHMKLHMQNLFIAAGATISERKQLNATLLKQLKEQHKLSLTDVNQLLESIRK